jgi:hypothetical protein
MAYRIFWCSELKALKAARITNNNAVQISRCFLAVGKKATGQVPPIPRVDEGRHPHWHPAIQCLP